MKRIWERLLRTGNADGIRRVFFQDECRKILGQGRFGPARLGVDAQDETPLPAFGLDFTYSINLGFKDSLANRGALTWDLLQDNIDTDHIEYRSYAENVTHQGL